MNSMTAGIDGNGGGLFGGLVLAYDGAMLVSAWQPVIYLATLGLWAWIISNVLDKHAARFYLPREKWNLLHLVIGLIAVLAAVIMPVPGIGGFFAAWGAMIVLLSASIAAYALSVNKDDRVPEQFRIGFATLFGGGPGLPGEKKAQKKGTEKGAKAAKVKLVIKGPDKAVLEAPAAETPELAVRTMAEEVFIKAIDARASQVDIAPGVEGQYSATALVDGFATPLSTMATADAVRMMDFWKGAAKLDVADRRKKLTGVATASRADVNTVVRVTSQGTSGGGMRVTLLFNPEAAVRRKGDDLGLLPKQMEDLQALLKGKGVVLVVAPADGGRTTLTYTIAGMHDAYTQTVQTVEIEQQLSLEGVRHQVFDAGVDGADFATLVRSMLRRDPDVLAITELPDANTAKEVAKVDSARSRVYLSIKADNALTALEGYVRAVGDAELAAKSLSGVIAGKLLRKLCVNCKTPYPPSADMLKRLGLSEGKGPGQLFKKGGQVLIKNKPDVCPVCNGVGYLGQEGIFEIYPLGSEERELIREGNFAGVKASLKKKGYGSIQSSAIAKSLSGTTSVEEVMRVTQPAEKPAAKA